MQKKSKGLVSAGTSFAVKLRLISLFPDECPRNYFLLSLSIIKTIASQSNQEDCGLSVTKERQRSSPPGIQDILQTKNQEKMLNLILRLS